ncbi:magnesium transporter CorA family protein [Ruoffia tabacinasalis]|uniref:Magnesium transporter CorA family protein n=1 Tax=Ruoffia tabacinasalis TaxID=87458 RepID=A0ABS0LKH2_9LACT|nr:magnesium transporter CorA family protein [Ruoffia tabacinasalis]MBG9978130.1 magnesium transporter CorA family protein [Ruoffia tabacinasalis]
MLEHYTMAYGKNQVDKSYDFYHLWQANEQEIQQMLDQFDIPEDFITSGLDSYEVARWESYKADDGDLYTLVLFNYPFKERTQDFHDVSRTAPIAIVFKPGLVIVTSIDSLKTLNHITEMRLNSFNCLDELGLVLNILWFIARLFIILLEEIDREIRDLELDVTESTKNEIFYTQMKLNKALVFFNSAINNDRDVLEHLKEQFNQLDIEDNDLLHLRDVNVELHQASGMVHELKQLNEKVSDILSNVVNNNVNQVMRVLTVWSIILTIPTIITSAWGMNVPVPGEEATSSMFIIGIITLILVLIGYWLFKRNKWL